MQAMVRAVEGLSISADYLLIDGNCIPSGLNSPAEAVVKGDGWVDAISAASIIAKVVRDQEMVELDERYPGYGLARHKGYPTQFHISALAKLGVTPIHRRSFRPVAAVLAEQSPLI